MRVRGRAGVEKVERVSEEGERREGREERERESEKGEARYFAKNERREAKSSWRSCVCVSLSEVSVCVFCVLGQYVNVL